MQAQGMKTLEGRQYVPYLYDDLWKGMEGVEANKGAKSFGNLLWYESKKKTYP